MTFKVKPQLRLPEEGEGTPVTDALAYARATMRRAYIADGFSKSDFNIDWLSFEGEVDALPGSEAALRALLAEHFDVVTYGRIQRT